MCLGFKSQEHEADDLSTSLPLLLFSDSISISRPKINILLLKLDEKMLPLTNILLHESIYLRYLE